MTSIQHHVVTQSHTSSSSSHLDNHLDALLDDLQTTVGRPETALTLATQNGSIMNGSTFGGQINLPPGASGYREITTTVTRAANGVPMTSREYQIEYLNPANSVTILDDRSSSPSMDLLKTGDLAGHQIQSYKTEVYDYKISKTTSNKKSAGFDGNQRGIEDGRSRSIESHLRERQTPEDDQFSHREERSDSHQGKTHVSKNLNELDMLLKELNNPPNGVPGETRTTPRRERVHTVEMRNERNSGRFAESPSTMPKRSASATRELVQTERTEQRMNRARSPTIPSGSSKSPARTVNVRHEYNTMESSQSASRRGTSSTRNRTEEMSPILRGRSPSPSSGEFRPSNFSNYPISPKDLTPTRSVTTKSYSTAERRRTPTPAGNFEDHQPYRSPSPVSFPQKRSPSPTGRALNRSESGRTVSYQVSPQVPENPAVITYKYSSQSREQTRYPAGGYEARDDPSARPFPSTVPVHAGEQHPPKKLDDLMASFEDTEVKSAESGNYTQNRQMEYARESRRERHDGGLQRSPSFERNVRPSGAKVTQSYSQSQHQHQAQEYQNQYHQREQYQQVNQREQQPASAHQKEFQRREEYSTREQYPGYYPPQQPQDQSQHQGSQYSQHQQSQGGYQREHREQYHHSQEQNQQYQYQQQQQQQQQQRRQYQQNSSQMPVNESMSSSMNYRMGSGSKSVAGPPVYYPPGVELFAKKEEAMLKQEQSGGKKKSKGKSKSEKGKGKEKGATGVPVCLPVCCAMPCSIM